VPVGVASGVAAAGVVAIATQNPLEGMAAGVVVGECLLRRPGAPPACV